MTRALTTSLQRSGARSHASIAAAAFPRVAAKGAAERHSSVTAQTSVPFTPIIAPAAEPVAGGSVDPRVYRPMTETVRTFLKPAHFVHLLKAHGTTFFTGVPDSLMKDVLGYINDTMSPNDHVVSPNEGTALATGAGHYLATGNIPCVYLQNSGLGNMANPLLSLCSTDVYSIPILMMMGWRGEPGKKDEPQHQLQGRITPAMLETMGVPFAILPDYAEGAFEVLQKAYAHMNTKKGPYVILVKKQTFEEHAMTNIACGYQGQEGVLHREQILKRIIGAFPSAPTVCTTGFASRELFELRVAKGQSHENDFLTVGSMGHASSIALGIARSKPKEDIVCIDGDGAALMHMGAMAAVGRTGYKNYKHVLINNAIHDSVGGQTSGGLNVDFAGVARACGYAHVSVAGTAAEVEAELQKLSDAEGPGFLEIKCLAGARADLGRPTTTTIENKDAFMAKLGARGDN